MARSFRYASFPLSDCRVSGFIAPAQFVGLGLCFAKPLSGPPNLSDDRASGSHTAGTLCAIRPETVKIYEKQSKSNINLLKNRNLSAIIKTFRRKVLK
jgi:hypothetical protein